MVTDIPLKPLVCVPTYNERGNIANLIARILESLPIADIMVIDDGSPDGTGGIVDEIGSREPRVHCIHRAGKMGLGTAYITAFKSALERDYTHCFEMDADFSHDPARPSEIARGNARFRYRDRLALLRGEALDRELAALAPGSVDGGDTLRANYHRNEALGLHHGV